MLSMIKHSDKKVQIENDVYCNMVSDYNRDLLFIAYSGPTRKVESLNKSIKSEVVTELYIDGRRMYLPKKKTIKISKHSDGVSHTVILADNNELNYVISLNKDNIEDDVFNHIYQNYDIPMIKEWKNYIFETLRRNGGISNNDIRVYGDKYKDSTMYSISIRTTEEELRSIISDGIKNDSISISDNKRLTDEFKEMEGIDDYLNMFSSSIAKKIENSFTPKFDPEKDKYSNSLKAFDQNCIDKGIQLFEAQKNVIEATSRNLDKNDTTFIVGEMGVGKTILGASIPFVHSHGKPTTNIVMCPSHLVNKWKREIDTFVPKSKTYILNSYEDVIELEDEIRDKERDNSIYMIVSKDKAKSSYDLRPAVMWSERRQAFICPECYRPVKHNTIKYRLMAPWDMNKKRSINDVCSHRKENGEECGAKLWTILNKDEELKWYKIGSDGWFHEDTIDMTIRHLSDKKDKASRKVIENEKRVTFNKSEESTLFNLIELRDKLREGEEVERVNRSSERYSISTYVKKFLKKEIDYFIADEVHLLKGKSLQGESFDDFIKSSKKTITLTGTLLNGYADSIFYTLYRTIPRTLIEDGFAFNDANEFLRTYGVYESIDNRDKKLPGVSPVVFTKFLLEISAFISLSDMSDGLPSYKEIPIGVNMDKKLKEKYKEIEDKFVEFSNSYDKRGMSGVGTQFIQSLSMYPDDPNSASDIYKRSDNEIYYRIPRVDETSLSDMYNDTKLEKTLEIVKSKVEAGEKVLIYVAWTGKTEIQEKIRDEIQSLGINAKILKGVSPDKREQWIEKELDKGMEVMICNPILVETGLDLLPFTTILFYQLGHNIFTMRQASRRSWRLSQTKDIEVYFLYYKDTVQEQVLSLMASKLKASMAIEGKFSEEGLRAMSDNQDLTSQIANSLIKGIKNSVDDNTLSEIKSDNENSEMKKYRRKRIGFIKEPLLKKNHQKKTKTRRAFERIFNSPTKLLKIM